MGLSTVHGTGVRQQNVSAKDTQDKVELAELFPPPPLIQQLWVHGNKLQKGDKVFHPPNSKFPCWARNPVLEEQNSEPKINFLRPYPGTG